MEEATFRKLTRREMWEWYLKPAINKQRALEKLPSLEDEEKKLQEEADIKAGKIVPQEWTVEAAAAYVESMFGVKPVIVEKKAE